MEKILHLYLGQKLMCTEGNSDLEYKGLIVNNSPLLLDKHSNGNWKLLLRPLSSMTEEEGFECFESEWDGDSPNVRDIMKQGGYSEDSLYSAKQFQHLLSKGFDLFNLISQGKALDATNVSTTTPD